MRKLNHGKRIVSIKRWLKSVYDFLGSVYCIVQSRNKWRRRIKGQPANPGSPRKMAVKTECVCVLFHCFMMYLLFPGLNVIYFILLWHAVAYLC